MEVKAGYKQTEIGVIPDDWEVKTVDEIGLVTSGKRLPLGTSLTERETAHPYIRVTDMRPGTVLLSNIRYVPDEVYPYIKNYRIFHDDIFISVAGTLGIVGKVPQELNGANLTENADRITNISCSRDYLLYVLMAPRIQNTIKSLQTVGAQPKLALTRIRKFLLPLPTLSEQKTIAAALSDTDASLRALDELLAKKRAIKQAAMQQLLTGKTRLPGFAGAWKVHCFGDLAFPRKNRLDPKRSKQCDFCIEMENIEQMTGCLLGYTSTNEQSSLKSVFYPGDVLFGKLRAYLRKYWLADRSGVCSTEIWVLAAKSLLMTPEYLFQLVKDDRFIEATSTAYGTHMPRSDWNTVRSLEISVPPLAEQAAIAAVLSDMDAEIAAVQQTRDKTRDVRHAMMQELLTGRTRLL